MRRVSRELRCVWILRLRSIPTSSSKKRRTHGPITCGLAMGMLLSHRGITLKAPRGLGEQFRGHGEVYLGPGHMAMTKIGRQQGQSRFHIDTLAVPGDDTVDGHGVPEVMEAGLPPIRRRSPNAGMLPQTPKDFFKLLAGDGVAASRGKKSGARAGGLGQGFPRPAGGPQRPAQIPSQGGEKRL